MSTPTIHVKCPTCQQRIEWSENNPYRPFCCERCRLIDLGDWATETHRIPDLTPNLDESIDTLYPEG
jgi:uncharacterized protein